MRSPGPNERLATLASAVSFLVAGLLGSVLFWAADRSYYAEFAREARLDSQAFHLCTEGQSCGTLRASIDALLSIDDTVRAGVLTGDSARFQVEVAGRRFFGSREIAHLEDVAAIFSVVKPLAVLAAVVTVIGLVRGLRDDPVSAGVGALAAGGLVVAVGALAAVAFEPAFLLFHRIFFPQGNFLFDPASDNLVLLYPESYWLGVTLRVGATFVFMALTVAALASVAELRRRQLAR